MLVKLDHFPRDRGENKKYLSCHHLEKVSKKDGPVHNQWKMIFSLSRMVKPITVVYICAIARIFFRRIRYASEICNQKFPCVCKLSCWWFQPIRKICSSNWIMKPQRSGMKIPKYLSCHQPARVYNGPMDPYGYLNITKNHPSFISWAAATKPLWHSIESWLVYGDPYIGLL